MSDFKTKQVPDVLRPLSDEEYLKLPVISDKEIEAALDQGRKEAMAVRANMCQSAASTNDIRASYGHVCDAYEGWLVAMEQDSKDSPEAAEAYATARKWFSRVFRSRV